MYADAVGHESADVTPLERRRTAADQIYPTATDWHARHHTIEAIVAVGGQLYIVVIASVSSSVTAGHWVIPQQLQTLLMGANGVCFFYSIGLPFKSTIIYLEDDVASAIHNYRLSA